MKKEKDLPKGIRQRGEMQFQVQIRMKDRATGLMCVKSETFTTMTQAKEWQDKMKVFLREGLHKNTKTIDSTPLRYLIQKYIDEVSPTKLGSKQEIVRLNAWLKHPLANRMMSRCTPKDFADYIAFRRKDKSKRGGKVAEQTIKHEIIVISNVFEVARKDWGYDMPNPTKQISKPKGSGTREVRIVPEDWKKIAGILSQRRNLLYVVIAEFAIETGMREDEIFRMAWKDIDLQSRKVIVEGKDTSATGQRKKRTVPLSPRAIELLTALPRHIDSQIPVFQVERKTSADGLSRAFTAACKSIGLAGGCFHCTRHEAASRMAPHFPMLTLMKIFGWKTPAMAARYYHTTDDELLAGIDRMQRASQSA